MRFRILLLLIIAVSFAFEGRSQVVETSDGRVEFIGLEKWTPQMIQEKLGYQSSDKLHHCASDLKKIGFADSSVKGSRDSGGRRYTVVTVIEPQYASRVKYRPKPVKSLPTPDEWQELVPIVKGMKFINGMMDYGRTLKSSIKVEAPQWQAKDEEWWKLLQQRRTEKDYRLALERLREDGDTNNRIIAAMVLANFFDRDAAWIALMDGVRDAEFFVNVTSYQVLSTLAAYVPRRVDWSKAASSIRDILSGTNLNAFEVILNVLMKTQISPKLARVLLNENSSRMLLEYLKANRLEEKEKAHRFLIQISGKDYGYDVVSWRKWIESQSRVHF